MAVNKSDFQAAVAYALSCLQHDRLVLRDQQMEAVKMLYEGQDVFLWVPTGYGKLICYQMLPFLFDVVTNVLWTWTITVYGMFYNAWYDLICLLLLCRLRKLMTNLTVWS